MTDKLTLEIEQQLLDRALQKEAKAKEDYERIFYATSETVTKVDKKRTESAIINNIVREKTQLIERGEIQHIQHKTELEKQQLLNKLLALCCVHSEGYITIKYDFDERKIYEHLKYDFTLIKKLDVEKVDEYIRINYLHTHSRFTHSEIIMSVCDFIVSELLKNTDILLCNSLSLRSDLIIRMKLAINSGRTERNIAIEFNSTQSTVHAIKWGAHYKDILPLTKQQGWIEVRKEHPVCELEQWVLELDENLDPKENSLTLGIAVILLSSLMVGADVDGINYHTEYGSVLIKRVAENLAKYGIWENGQCNYEWVTEEGVLTNLESVVSFWCTVLVAEGKLGCYQE